MALNLYRIHQQRGRRADRISFIGARAGPDKLEAKFDGQLANASQIYTGTGTIRYAW